MAHYAVRNASDGDVTDLRTPIAEIEARLEEGDLRGISEVNTRLLLAAGVPVAFYMVAGTVGSTIRRSAV